LVTEDLLEIYIGEKKIKICPYIRGEHKPKVSETNKKNAKL